MDSIDRQAAIAYAISGRIRTLATSEGGENWIRTEEVRQSLLTMPSAQQWIPVSERLPKDGERVLVTYDILEKYPWVNILQFGHDELNRSEQGFYYYDDEWGDCPIRGVKAWMPLPEPYKKETDDGRSI